MKTQRWWKYQLHHQLGYGILSWFLSLGQSVLWFFSLLRWLNISTSKATTTFVPKLCRFYLFTGWARCFTPLFIHVLTQFFENNRFSVNDWPKWVLNTRPSGQEPTMPTPRPPPRPNNNNNVIPPTAYLVFAIVCEITFALRNNRLIFVLRACCNSWL